MPRTLRCLLRQGTYSVSSALAADRAWKRALGRYRQTCAFVSGWSQVLAVVGPRVAPTPRNPHVVNVSSLPRRTIAPDPVSHGCDGQVGRVPRRSHACSKTISLQRAVCAVTLRTERLLPKPPQASMSRQTSRHRSAQADVLASVA